MSTTSKPAAAADPETIASWRKVFDSFDVDASGTISSTELEHALRALGQNPSPERVRAMLSAAGVAANGDLSFEQFMDLVTSRETVEIDRVELRQLFQTIDLDGSDYITAAELRHFMSNLRIHVSDNRMAELVRIYDLDGDGQITLEEFEGIVGQLGFVVTDEEGEEDTAAEQKAIDESAARPAAATDEEQGPVVPLSTVSDETLRAALAPLSKDGGSNVSAADVAEAAALLVESRAPKSSLSRLHWDPKAVRHGLGNAVEKVNHIALIVSDVGRSTRFYVDVIGLQQIRRPNFDRHGAWFTMGNVELHLIKGTPIVPSGDDLIVGHISVETQEIASVPAKLRKMGVPFRQNVSVPKGKDAGSGTNASATTSAIVRQYFLRDPDGYYIEICNCDVLTEYCLGTRESLGNYDEAVRPLSLANAAVTVRLMQEWSKAGEESLQSTAELTKTAKACNGDVTELAKALGCTRAETVDEKLLGNLMTRMSVYGDVCQNETAEMLREITLACGNDAVAINRIVAVRAEMRGTQKMQAPAFYEDGKLVRPPSTVAPDA